MLTSGIGKRCVNGCCRSPSVDGRIITIGSASTARYLTCLVSFHALNLQQSGGQVLVVTTAQQVMPPQQMAMGIAPMMVPMGQPVPVYGAAPTAMYPAPYGQPQPQQPYAGGYQQQGYPMQPAYAPQMGNPYQGNGY